MTATIGQVQLIPNTNGSLGRVVSVYPLYQVDPTEAVSAVQLQAIERAAAARVAAAPRPASSSSSGAAGDGTVDPATLLAAQAALPAGQFDSATASAVAQAVAQAATRTVQRTEVSGAAFKTEQQMNSGEKAELAELRARDVSVRKEEQTHAATAGVYAGSPQYRFERGPDGRQYAVEGSVSVKISAATLSSPEKAAAALKTIQDAALSPENPSAGDLAVFTQARAAQASNRYRQSQALAQKGAAADDDSADATAGSDRTDQTDSSTASTDDSQDDSWLPPGALPEWKREKELSLSV